jgi:hypothetical protein
MFELSSQEDQQRMKQNHETTAVSVEFQIKSELDKQKLKEA